MKLPMPGDYFDGRIVIASVWQNDEPSDGHGPIAMIMALNPRPSYYTVGQIEWSDGGWRYVYSSPHVNIVYAVRDYENSGGDV